MGISRLAILFLVMVFVASLLPISSGVLADAMPITFTGEEMLGRPTDNSITINVVPDENVDIYYQCGTSSGNYLIETPVLSATAGEPHEVLIGGLAPNTLYYYRMQYQQSGASTWIARDEHTFHTQRALGSDYTFTIISDSHLGQYGGQTANEFALYEQTILNVADDEPDFHIDLGDTAAMDPSPLGTGMTPEEADAAYAIQRPYLGFISHSVPIYLAIGNHENEEGWNWDDTFTPPDESLATVGIEARKKYFPNPVPDGAFYNGNLDPLSEPLGGDTNHEDYYSWTWGDALFVVLDPFHYSMTWPNDYGEGYGGEGQDGEVGGDRWDWTLGIEQYLWLKDILETSDSTYKFIFAHHVTGGSTPYGRGGISAAPYFEWGGRNADGSWGWDTERPAAEGWDVPVHQLMADNGVNIFFHGHDHVYAYEELDGIVYLECPKPDDAGYDWEPYGYGYTEGLYPDALMIQNSGHIRVNVNPDDATVEYVRSYLPGDGTNKEVAHSFTIPAITTTHDLTLDASPDVGSVIVPAEGTHTYAEGAVISISAIPAPGYAFDSWIGGDVADPNSANTTVTMDTDKTVTAEFIEVPLYVDGAVSSNTADGVSSISFAHTTGTGDNRLMLVGISSNSYNNARTITSVVFNDGSDHALTEVGSIENEAGRLVAIYGLVDPPSGAEGTVTVSFSGAVNYGINAGAINFAGVHQTTPWGTFFSNVGQSTDQSVELTGLNGDELVFDTAFLGGATIPTATVGAGQTEWWITSVDRAGGLASTEQATSSSVTMSWSTGSTSVYWAIGAVPINPVLTGPTHDLTMVVDPFEGGTTNPSVGVHTYSESSEIILEAIPATGYIFSNWSGGVTGSSNPSTITMDGDKMVTAHFAAQNYDLTIAVTPGGSGTTTPTAGVHLYGAGSVVDITAEAATGYRFVNWTGDVTNPNSTNTTVTMDANKTVTANFVEFTGIIIDGAFSSNTADDVSDINISHITGTGTNRLMLVGVSWNCGTTDRTISSVTFTPDGGSATALDEVFTQQANAAYRYSAIYSLLAPPSGTTSTVTVTFSGSVSNGIVAGVANFAGVDQTTPLGTPSGDGTDTNDTAPSVILTGLDGDELVFDNVFQGASGESQTLTAGTDQTQLWDGWIANVRAAASVEQATVSSVTMSWTAGSAAYWAIAAVPINPAQTGPTYDLTVNVVGNGTVTQDPLPPYCVGDDTSVTLTATADPGWTFDGWSGDLSGSTNPETITMDGDKSVTATFTFTGIIGDVNGDGIANSTDALIILSCDVGIDTSAFCPMNCGDVNDDGLINSTDALIILSYDVGISVPYPVGEPGYPSSVTPCPGCSP
jgi:uncharacterized repeat protein (TIGR02543 family)